MNLARYPYLFRVYQELTEISARLDAEDAAKRSGGLKVAAGRDVNRVSWPGLGDYWLTGPQLAVVRELASALLHSARPEVDEVHLLRVAGTKHRRLRDVFYRSPAWGELVLSAGAGQYRLFAPVASMPDDAA